MKSIWFEYWGGMVDVKVQSEAPSKGRYLCTDFDEGYDFYDVDEAYVIGVPLD